MQNKHMHKKRTDQLPLLQVRWSQCYLKWIEKHEDKEHGKTLKHEAQVVKPQSHTE